LADHWREIAGLDDQRVIDLIREDQIDVLVDLSGHTDRNRLSVFARHPAPVQASWLGYLNTTGLPAMDYRICDWHTDPLGATEHLHSEQLVRMPDSQWCYAPWYNIDYILEPHAARPDDIVFGSFNQLIKLTDTTLSLWSRILAKVERAKLVVFDVRQSATAQTLLRRMEQHGIDTSRVILRGREPLREYFAAIGNVDIALDTMPYNGATTTLDTLWMGVPIVALRGERGIARGSYSILCSLGADELIALNSDDYVELNVSLAHDPQRRASMRRSLRGRLAASPLMDTHSFTRALEERYREMWRAWCRKLAGSSTH
jgi:predicted O-linked N-acetylglucosamine transferase (SPINDLY family)